MSGRRDAQTSAQDKSGAWPRWLSRGPLEAIATLVIGLGVLMLLQPLSITLYSYSFVTTLAGVVLFTVVSKFPE